MVSEPIEPELTSRTTTLSWAAPGAGGRLQKGLPFDEAPRYLMQVVECAHEAGIRKLLRRLSIKSCAPPLPAQA